jgi:hypothetical protein
MEITEDDKEEEVRLSVQPQNEKKNKKTDNKTCATFKTWKHKC